jgi:3-deoxy-manno-octulosonate cytidylyltransferase (CMP-KDO synthetase)
VAEVAGRPEYASFEVVANIQGDEPLIEEGHLRAAAELVQGGSWEVGTCATPLRTRDALEDPSVVKVARAGSGAALYFSRAPIPWKRDDRPGDDDLAVTPFLRHIGVYVYGRNALQRWVSLPPSPLEVIERLEQLRPLEDGLAIGVAVVDHASPGVDTPDDARRIEALLEATDTILR